MKDIIETDECKEFYALLNPEEAEDYISARKTLRETGRLEYPYGEKVKGENNLFANKYKSFFNF